jgi:rifampin ADP-ribosylating transferase
VSTKVREFTQTFFHGTKADLKLGDQIVAGKNSNYGQTTPAKFVYLTANLSAATWGAELAIGEEPGRIYVVEPTGPFENDPNLTDKKYPGNPTNSYRTRSPLLVVGEVIHWQGHSSEEIRLRKQALERVLETGAKIIEE